MSRYLLVAHQTAGSDEVIRHVRGIVRSDPDARFVLLVPATPLQHLLTWAEGEARAVARREAEAARTALEMTGAAIERIEIGDESPLLAIEDELREHPDQYDALIICTFPAGLSRWLKTDLPEKARRKFSLPVTHIVAERRPQAEGAPTSAFD